MADTVQVMMEKMIPELEDLQEKKLFSPDEIHQIVEKRREFEYMMRRVPLRKIDGLRYIEYELNLEALRKKRKDRFGLKKMSLSDTAGIKRVHAIFDRVLYKHRGSVDLWLQYIEFCKAQGSGRVLAHIFTRALQSHPRSPELWIEAASFEFSQNLSVDSARVLMQRAIRINKGVQKLWHEYFRLELLYIQKLSVRREILKLDGDSDSNQSADNGASVLLEELPEEQNDDRDAEEIAAEMEKKRTRAMILDGAIPRIIFKNAVTAIPDDVTFRLTFVEISDLFGRRFAANLSQSIVDACVEDFPRSELVHAVKALRPFVVEDDLEKAERRSVELFEKSVNELGTVAMTEKFVEWIVNRLSSPDKTSYLVGYAKTALLKFVAQVGEASHEVCMNYVDFVQRTEGTSKAIAAIQDIVGHQNPRSAGLWLLYSQLVLYAHAGAETGANEKRSVKRRRTTDKSPKKHERSSVDEAFTILEEALQRISSNDYDGLLLIHQRIVELMLADRVASPEIIETAFKRALKSQPVSSIHWSKLRDQYITWAAAGRPMDVIRGLYKKFMEDGQLLPNEATHAFLLRCIDIETSVISTDVHIDQVRMLFEKLIDLFGLSHEEIWVTYIQFYKDQGRFADANSVLHRARRVWKDSPQLMELLV